MFRKYAKRTGSTFQIFFNIGMSVLLYSVTMNPVKLLVAGDLMPSENNYALFEEGHTDYYRKFHQLQQKTGLFIRPNTVGAGFCPLHPGFVRIGHYVRIGKNCTVLPMVLIGKRRSGQCSITIGDNCYIGTGVTILGPLTIGNNVSIAAGAVVLSDILDNVVVAGVPAKVVKIKDLVEAK